MVASIGALLAFVIPSLLGLSVYLIIAKRPTRVEGAAVAWGAGWGIVNLVSFSANQFGGVRLDGTFYSVSAAAMGVAASCILALRRRGLRSLGRGPLVPPELRRWPGIIPVVLIGSFLGIVLYKGLTIPPASTDALVYHMQLPKLAFETGMLEARPGVGWLDVVTAWPNLLVTQQLWIYLGAGQFDETLVRPVMPVYTALLLLLVFRDARRWFGLPAATLAATGLFALNEFASLTIGIWAEVPVAFYSYLAVRAVVEPMSPRGSLMPAGVFAGMAALVKFNGFVLMMALALTPLVLAVWGRWRNSQTPLRPGLAITVRRVCGFMAAGLLVATPLILRNILVFENPIYPFLFGGVNTEQLGYYSADYSANDYIRFRLHETVILIGSPLAAGIALGLLRFRAWSQTERGLFLTYILYLPVYMFPPLGGSHVRYLAPVLPIAAVFVGPQFAWWISESKTRDRIRGSPLILGLVAIVAAILVVVDVKPPYLLQYAYVFVGSSALLLGLANSRHLFRAPGLRTAATVVLAVALIAPGMFAVVAERYPPREAAFDIQWVPQDRNEYLASRFGDDWRMWEWINANLPVNATVLTFEARLLYLERSVVFGSSHEVSPTYSMSLDEAVSFVRGLGVDFVLDSPWSHIPEVNRIFWSRSVLFQNLGNSTYFRLLHAEGQTRTYELL